MPEVSSSLDQSSSTETSRNAGESEVDLQKLAEQIYELFRKEIEIENERLGLS